MARKIQTLYGLPVYDADEPLMLEVVPVDINNRFRKDPGRCAIAQACKRELHVTEALAYRSRLYVKHGDHWKRYQMPETVRNAVIAFDQGATFPTGVYRIPVLTPSKRVDSPNRGGGGKRTGTGQPHTVREMPQVRAHSPLMGGALETTAPYRKTKKED